MTYRRHNYDLSAGWSSLVARRAHNPKVAGSNPAPATFKSQMPCLTRKRLRMPNFFSKSSTNTYRIKQPNKFSQIFDVRWYE